MIRLIGVAVQLVMTISFTYLLDRLVKKYRLYKKSKKSKEQ